MRVVFMGTPGFAVPFLEHLVRNGYEVVGVYTQPDRPAGRGRAVVPSPVKLAARSHNLPVFQPDSLRLPEATAQLAGFKPDVIIITAYGQILSQAVLDVPPRGCINAHFSLLPKYRGAAPVAAAVLAGDEFTGVTIMLVERKVDTGPVLARLAIPIAAADTTGSLLYKLSQVGARFMPEVVARWRSGEISARTQDESGASYFPVITKEAGRIDWHEPAVIIWRRVRAYNPWPGGYTSWQGKQLKIIEAVPLPRRGDFAAGQVLPPESGVARVGFGVATGEGALGVVRVQLEGKEIMAAADFVRGQRNFFGAVLPS